MQLLVESGTEGTATYRVISVARTTGAGGKVTGGILERGGSEKLSRGFSKVMSFSLTSFRPPGRLFKRIVPNNPARPPHHQHFPRLTAP